LSNDLPQTPFSVLFWTEVVDTLEEGINNNWYAKECVKCGLDARGQKPEAQLDRVKLEYTPEYDEGPQHELLQC
jgi:hypothetical protein